MASTTDRTERLVKALKAARPDFTLHTARVFAQAVIEAPDNIYAASPLTFLRGVTDESDNHQRPDRQDSGGRPSTEVDMPGGKLLFPSVNAAQLAQLLGTAHPRSGDLVVGPAGTVTAIVIGPETVFDGEHVRPLAKAKSHAIVRA
ncbi:hypothetical protein ABFV47_14460 [Mycolicibacterium fortuitum]|uniref:hypothetical protein n=1 Tax=Mycolicibacterium TaxID=1866885 RepID=UPI003204A576